MTTVGSQGYPDSNAWRKERRNLTEALAAEKRKVLELEASLWLVEREPGDVKIDVKCVDEARAAEIAAEMELAAKTIEELRDQVFDLSATLTKERVAIDAVKVAMGNKDEERKATIDRLTRERDEARRAKGGKR